MFVDSLTDYIHVSPPNFAHNGVWSSYLNEEMT